MKLFFVVLALFALVLTSGSRVASAGAAHDPCLAIGAHVSPDPDIPGNIANIVAMHERGCMEFHETWVRAYRLRGQSAAAFHCEQLAYQETVSGFTLAKIVSTQTFHGCWPSDYGFYIFIPR